MQNNCMDRENIFLIGFMGVGKSTMARLLAGELDAKLIEMDETIEEETQMSISAIFEQYGEEHFRDLETELIRRIAGEGGAIVSCGGGAVLRAENVRMMKESGRIVFLSATAETIYERVKDSTNRPLLAGNMNVEYIAKLIERRQEAYEQAADVTIATDGKSMQTILTEILNL